MHVSNMIYQAATAHQSELRNTASARTPQADPKSDASAWIRVFSHVKAQQARAQAAARSARSSVAIGRLSA